ncbi:hypothetical protein E8E12_002128 [Didymella heteroderae]|uniref:Uncharacterized protein n=1 Tax=Didymella heteroderae TaxID=1769908 RepID=A0A9P5BWV8_9PLEO|nr:hypothetical protein E8E12_002128 [Didymella heteroderae]
MVHLDKHIVQRTCKQLRHANQWVCISVLITDPVDLELMYPFVNVQANWLSHMGNAPLDKRYL